MLIGLVGKKRAGKDSFASRLTSAHGFVRYAFADPLKALMLELDPFVDSTIDIERDTRGVRLSEVIAEIGWEGAKEIPEVRRLLQAHGDAARRHIGEDVWLSATMEKVLREPRPVVVTDVRYPNEADAIEAHGGTLVRIIRTGRQDNDNHITETALDDRRTPYVVLNSGTLGDLYGYADALVRALSR